MDEKVLNQMAQKSAALSQQYDIALTRPQIISGSAGGLGISSHSPSTEGLSSLFQLIRSQAADLEVITSQLAAVVAGAIPHPSDNVAAKQQPNSLVEAGIDLSATLDRIMGHLQRIAKAL